MIQKLLTEHIGLYDCLTVGLRISIHVELNMKFIRKNYPFLCLFVFQMLVPVACTALEFENSIRLINVIFDNPSVGILYSRNTDVYSGAVFRFIVKEKFSGNIRFECNTIHSISNSTALPMSGFFNLEETQANAYRHSNLEWNWHDRRHGVHLSNGMSVIDRLMMTKRYQNWEWILGRQPVQLGTCFFLSPNDLFQPFSPEAYYRDYKPGVDAVRIRYFSGRIGDGP